MVKAIDLDNEALLAAEKVDDIGAKRDLSGKLEAVKASCPQVAPKTIFFFRFISPEPPSLGGLAWASLCDVLAMHRAIPLIRLFGPPSPRRGEGVSCRAA